MKEVVAQEIARRVRDGETIGVGTGSTVDVALEHIAKRIAAEKLSIQVVPTSLESAWRCQEIGLKVLYPGYCGELAWGFDGADAVDKNLWLIKGKGGALLQEKILAARCKKFVVIVDESKIVSDLAAACAVPLEIVPQALAVVQRSLKSMGHSNFKLREGSGKHGPVITEQGNLLIDVQMAKIGPSSEKDLKSIVGVVDSGLFIGYASEVLVGAAGGLRILKS